MYWMDKRIKFKKFFVGVLILTIGFFIGYIVKPSQILSSKAIREHTDKYKFIHPLLAVNRTTNDPSPAYKILASKIESLITDKIANGSITKASVYFIGYTDNGSFSVNDQEQYFPASMLKVVIMIAYLKESESDKSVLDREIVYTSDIKKNLEVIPFNTPTLLKVGHSYSVKTLIDKMIIDSDNGAKDTLLLNISDSYLNQVFSDLGISVPKDDTEYKISVRDYSLFLRVLYNSTYLNDENSEKALIILSKASFKDGILSGLPAETVVAHKFGEHINGEEDKIDSVELHDCGIVYAPEHQYLLCVMTRGKTLSNLSGTIGEISKIVYDYLNKK